MCLLRVEFNAINATEFDANFVSGDKQWARRISDNAKCNEWENFNKQNGEINACATFNNKTVN